MTEEEKIIIEVLEMSAKINSHIYHKNKHLKVYVFDQEAIIVSAEPNITVVKLVFVWVNDRREMHEINVELGNFLLSDCLSK